MAVSKDSIGGGGKASIGKGSSATFRELLANTPAKIKNPYGHATFQELLSAPSKASKALKAKTDQNRKNRAAAAKVNQKSKSPVKPVYKAPPQSLSVPPNSYSSPVDSGPPAQSPAPASSIPSGVQQASVKSGPSAYDQYQKMIAQFNPTKMAAGQFNPQYAMLDRLNADAQKRYGANNKTMGDMYGALQASIRGDAKGISANYDNAGSQIASNYAKTQQEASNYQNSSKQNTAELLQRLGIQAAAPDVLGNADASGARWNSLMSASNQIASNANTRNKSSSLNYNNTMGERAGFEGAAQQADLMSGRDDFINQNAVRRLGLRGEQSGAESGYKMKLMDMYGQMASQQGAAESDAANRAQQQSNWERSFAQDQQNRESSATAAAQASEASAIKAAQAQDNWARNFEQNRLKDSAAMNRGQQSQMTPYQKLAQTAAGYSNIWGPTDQAGMAKMITNQYQDSDGQAAFNNPNQSQSMNGQEFIRQLMQANPHIQQQQAMQDMATQFFNNMYKK